MPSRAAVSRSIDERRLQAAVLLIGVDVGELRQRAAARAAAAAPTSRSVVEVVACERVLVAARSPCRPPTRMSCTGCRKSCAPGTFASLARSRAIDLVAPIRRARSSGFSATNMRAGLREPPPPVKPSTVATAGIGAHDVDELLRASAASPGTRCVWSARMLPIRRPVSCCGKKPFGIDRVELDVERDRSRASTSERQRASAAAPSARLRS